MNSEIETLKPIGKMKGEINDKFEAFYLAVDKHGTYFINHNIDLSNTAYHKSESWKQITREELNYYKKHLHLLRAMRPGMRR